MIVAAAFGFALPFLIVKNYAQKRRDELGLHFPDALTNINPDIFNSGRKVFQAGPHATANIQYTLASFCLHNITDKIPITHGGLQPTDTDQTERG
jgi:Flp pilus assembly protein TadB